MTTEPRDGDVQQVVANLLQNPAEPLMKAVQRILPNHPREDQSAVFWAAKATVQQTVPSPLAAGRNTGEVPPLLVDRLKFAWHVLSAAESQIKSISASSLPTVIDQHFVRETLHGCIPVATLTDPLLEQVCNGLGIESSGRFFKTYHQNLKITKAVRPKQLALPVFDTAGRPIPENIRRALIWLIRRRRDQYIDVSRRPFSVHFAYLASQLRSDLAAWFDPRVSSISNINGQIEDFINDWLTYNCLEGESAPDAEDARQEIATAFVKLHRLTDRIVTPEVVENPAQSQKLRELEREITQYAEENRRLEDSLRAVRSELEQQRKGTKPPAASPVAVADIATAQDLKEALKLIDSKYSLEMLHEIQLGQDPPITMKNFVAHFFYVLRKKGLCTYPDDDSFDLTYENSGLFNCVGFQVNPGETVRVSVVTKGWGIKAKDRFMPIRYAQVKPAIVTAD